MTMFNSWVRRIPVRWFSVPTLLIATGLLYSQVYSQDLATLARAYRTNPSPQNRSAVEDFASTHADSSGALALLVLGTKEAVDLTSATKRLSLISDYPAFFSATARFDAEQYGEVERLLKPVWERSPASPLLAKSVSLLANAYVKQGQPRKALALVQLHLASLSKPAAELLLAKASGAAGDAAAERGHYERLLTEFPSSPEAAEAADDPARLAGLSPMSHLNRAVRLLDRESGTLAIRDLELAIPSLTGAMLDRARLKLGVARYFARSYGPAYDWLRSLNLAGEGDAERLYYMVRCARRLDHAQDVQKSLEQLAAAHAQSRWCLQALVAAGDFQGCSTSFPADPQAADCHWRVAWAAYRAQRPEARDLFLNLVNRSPASDKVPSALYFLARIAESASDPATARAYYEEINSGYPNFFYATLARERLKSTGIVRAMASTATTAFLRSVAFPVRARVDFTLSAVARQRSERARLLASAGLDDLAENELRFGARTEGQPEAMALELAELAAAREAPDVGIRYIKQLIPNYLRLPLDSTPGKFWKLAFPLPYRAALEQHSRESNLDPFMVAALIRQESEFNPRIVSHANAYGLTQLLPSTARELARKLKMPMTANDILFTPDFNLRIGTYFLRSLLDRLGGRWEATLASYNAGPARVAQWLAGASFREPAEFVETIPFDETRNYVQSVLRNADLYRRLYGPSPGALASTDGDIGRSTALP